MFGEFLNEVERDHIREVTVEGRIVSGIYSDGRRFRSYMVDYPDLVKLLRQHNVKIRAGPPHANPWYVELLFGWAPVVIAAVVYFVWKRKA
jgi:cell division protease FtsH